MSNTPHQYSRRSFVLLSTGAVAAVAGLAGCGNKSGGSGKTQVEVFSWWTGPGEADGLAAMVKDFEKTYPNVKFKNAAVAGGSGTNAKAVLASRLQANNPPDSFQGHAGAELQDYIKAGQIEPLDDFYKEQKLDDVFPTQLVDQIKYGGHVYSVPVNIHRSNMLWFSPKVLSEAKIAKPPTSIPEFIDALKAVKANTSKIPLSLGAQWTADHLWESVMLAELGPDGWNALWKKGADWSSPKVTKALQDYKTILSYTNTEAASTDWQAAAKDVVDGKAAFNIMGDWAYTYFINPPPNGLNKKAGVDFDQVASPGTDGVYLWLSDSFTLPKGAPDRDAALDWLKEAGSKRGQDLFNPKKGSIPARKDADKSLYKGYLAWALEQWPKDKLAGSFWHGVVANNKWHTDIDSQIGLFLQSHDVDKLQQGLVQAAQNSGQI